jgi:signal transduction histidine kinase
VVSVEDTGPGIPSSIADQLFEPFVTAGKKNGVGLGLAFSHQTVLDHGRKCPTSPQESRTRLQKRAGQGQFRPALLLFELSFPRAVCFFEATRAKSLHRLLVGTLLL